MPRNEDKQLLNDVLDLFSRRRSCHLGQYLYSDPDPANPADSVRGASHWAQMVAHEDAYYVPREEAALIQSHGHQIRPFLPDPVDVLDFGIGSDVAILSKSIPLLKSLDVRRYIPVDLCRTYLDDARRLVGEHLKTVPIDECQADYFDFKRPFEALSNPLIFMGGGNLYNLPLDPGAGSLKEKFTNVFSRALEHWRKMIGKGHLLITADENCDKASLLAAYDVASNQALVMSFFHRIRRDTSLQGLDTDGFRYLPIWNQDQACVVHTVMVTRPQILRHGEVALEINEDDHFAIDASFKLSEDESSALFHQTGNRLVTVVRGQGLRLALYLVEMRERSSQSEEGTVRQMGRYPSPLQTT